MTDEVTKTIWGELISSTAAVGGITTMRQQANTEVTPGSPTQITSTDISRAAATGVTLGAAIPSNNAVSSLSSTVSSGNLVTTLNAFLSLYSQIRIFTFHRIRSAWGNGNGASITPDYTRTAFKTSPSVTVGSDGAPSGAYDSIEVGDVIDRSNYEAVIASLRDVITTNAIKSDVTVNYCHSSCHSVCHSARGRR